MEVTPRVFASFFPIFQLLFLDVEGLCGDSGGASLASDPAKDVRSASPGALNSISISQFSVRYSGWVSYIFVCIYSRSFSLMIWMSILRFGMLKHLRIYFSSRCYSGLNNYFHYQKNFIS